ncbi:MAG TPA: hypothetical protein VGK90_14285 [Rhizomicrobium sp.]
MNIDSEHHEPRKIGHKWFDAAIAIGLLLVSVSSLIVAVVHSQTLEKMAEANAKLVEANSWPYLGYGTGNSEGPNQDSIELRVTNDGVGPAKIEAAELKWQGTAYRNATDFLRACCGYKAAPSNDRLWMDLMTGRVLRAGETINFITLFRTPGDDQTWKKLDRARLSPALSVNICYCSVFDECWVEDVRRMSLKPQHVDRCDAPPIPFGVQAGK